MCLVSVLTGRKVPGRIQIRFEGKLPGISNFYLEQLACVARTLGVDWSMTIAPSKGVRAARDWHIDNCPTPYLWMGDDDVIYDHDCLFQFSVQDPNLTPDSWGFLAGIKVDASNVRGYPDWDDKVYSAFPSPGSPLNHYYAKQGFKLVETALLDAGNCVLNVPALTRYGLRFSLFEDSENSGGEDTIFAAKVRTKLNGWAVPSAQSVHLEKPAPFFTEIAARKELVKRSKQCLGIV
jgi:hypothetical protein